MDTCGRARQAKRSTACLRRDQRGGVGVAFALMLSTGIAIMGVAVDYSRRGNANSNLQSAADAAALAAVSATSGSREDAARRAFAANAGLNPAVSLSNLTVRIDNQQSTPTAVVTYEGEIRTVLTRIIGYTTLPLAGAATASRADAKFLELHIVLDKSASMGIAATPQGIRDLMAITLPYMSQADRAGSPAGCAFGCHSAASGAQPNDPTFETLARQNNIPLRFDVVKGALGSLLDSATAKAPAGTVRIGLYTFGEGAVKLEAPAAIYHSIRSALGGMIFEGETSNASLFPLLESEVGAQGDGSNASRPIKIVLIATDGVLGGRNANGHFPWNPSVCQSLKQRGIVVGVINTTYPEWDASDFHYNTWIRPIASQISPALRACATPGFYFEAAQSAEIKRAFEAFLDESLRAAGMGIRLTR